MPQLNPSPWLLTLVFLWTIYILIFPIKIMAHYFLGTPDPKTAKGFMTKNQTWQW